jgi:hypothetical protein
LAWFCKGTKTHAKIYAAPRLYTKDKKVNLLTRTLLVFCIYHFQRTFFVCAFQRTRWVEAVKKKSFTISVLHFIFWHGLKNQKHMPKNKIHPHF